MSGDSDMLYKVGAATPSSPAFGEERLYASSAFAALVEQFNLLLNGTAGLKWMTTAHFGISTDGDPIPVSDWTVAKPPDDIAAVYFEGDDNYFVYSIPVED